VRTFPRTVGQPWQLRQRWAAVLTAALLATGMATVPLSSSVAKDDLKHKQQQVQQRIKKQQKDLESSSAGSRRATAALQRSLGELRQARTRLLNLRDDLETAQDALQRFRIELQAARTRQAAAEDALQAGQDAVTEQRGEVVDVINELYQQGDPQLQAFASMLQAKNTADLTWSQEGENVIVGGQTMAYDNLRAAEVMLKVKEQNLADAAAEVATKTQQAHDQVTKTRGLRNDARAARAQVRTQVADRKAAAVKARRARAHDLAAIRRSRQHEANIRHRIALAAARAAHGSGFHGRTGGFLLRPVTGYITSPFGYRMHPIYHYWGLHDGDDFHAPCGTPLRASGTGTVMSRYYSSVWGNRLYLNLGMVNGKNVTVIYNHISRYAVGQGAHVTRGQTVAYAGTTGWSTACHLHFTVMVNGQPVNPMNWF
jgi:murein DD-endopeptidase MepM/ murein hydrolase activator NlpD